MTRTRRLLRVSLVAIIALVASCGVLVRRGLLRVENNVARGMEPTVYVDESVVLWMRPPMRVGKGEVVVAVEPRYGFAILKRVAATGGDVVSVRSGRAVINGARAPDLNPDYAALPGHPPPRRARPDRPATRLATGYVYLLGDNWRDSTDSRDFGPVPVTAVLGRALFVFGRGRWRPFSSVEWLAIPYVYVRPVSHGRHGAGEDRGHGRDTSESRQE